MKKITLLLMMTLAFVNMAKADVEWTIWEGGVTGGNVQFNNKVDLANLAVGDRIYVYGTGELSMALFKITSSWVRLDDSYGLTVIDEGKNYYHVVTSELLEQLNDPAATGWAISNWNGGKITKVSIKKGQSMIKTNLSSDSKKFGRWAVYYTLADEKVPTLANGDYFHLPAEREIPASDMFDLMNEGQQYTSDATFTGKTAIEFNADNGKAGWTINDSWLNANKVGGTVTVEFESAISAAVDLKIDYLEGEDSRTASATASVSATSVSVDVPTTSTYISNIYLQGNDGSSVTLKSAQVSYSNNNPYCQSQLSYNNGSGWTSKYSVNSFSHDNWIKVASDDDATTLSNKELYWSGSFYSCTGVDLYRPIANFTIGYPGYASFSCKEQVKVPAGITAYQATINGDGTKVVLAEITDGIVPANTGVIIKGNYRESIAFLSNSTTPADVFTTNVLNYVATDMNMATTTSGDTENDYYILYNSASNHSDNFPLGNDGPNIKWGSVEYSNKVITLTAQWGTLGWSFDDIDFSDYSKVVFEFAQATTGGTVKVEYVDGTVEYTNFTASNSTFTVEKELNPLRKNHVKYIYVTGGDQTSGTYTLDNVYLVKYTPEFRKTTSGTLAANKAYLKIPAGEGARALSIVFDDEQETTAIESVAPKAVAKDNVYYDLQGRQVAQPTKGLYIVNGKKVFIK